MLVSMQSLPPLATLQQMWASLSQAGTHGFFLSWPWTRTWLAALPSHIQPQLLTIKADNELIGMAVLVKALLNRNHIINSRTWALNATGDPTFDQISVEHNGLLVREGRQRDAWQAWAETFCTHSSDWDEICLRGVPPEYLRAWELPGLRVREESLQTSRFVDLAKVRADGREFLEQLGPNTRARIRYTRKTFEQKFGPLSVQTAQTIPEAFMFFGELKGLHQQSWLMRGEPGAFGYPFFEQFHTSLIQHHFHEGVIQLLRVKAGEQTVGVLYNFQYEKIVSMYQSGFNYALVEARNKQSPGLLTHALAIEHNKSAGHLRYDFLAGDSQYKQSLSTDAESLWWGRVQRHRAKFVFEDQARSVWRRLKQFH